MSVHGGQVEGSQKDQRRTVSIVRRRMGNTETDDNEGKFCRVSRMSFREVEGYNASEDPQKRVPVTRESTSVLPP
jgi:hypothetical protein